jgi:CRP-like cAMP-binding protein
MDGLTQYGADAQPDAQPDEKPDEKETEKEDDSELIQRAKACYQIGIDALSRWRSDAVEDLEFLAGEQWDGNVRSLREVEGRPALTVNRLPQFVRAITNEQRQSKPAITVNPVDSNSDIQTAEVLQGVIRNIEYTSNADSAYAAGGESAAITGIGYWDVRAEYEDERSFDQKLSIRRISNPLSVVLDPGTKEVAGDDARWAIISTDVSKSEWDSLYPDVDMPTSRGWEGEGDATPSWVGKEGVRIHEYRWIDEQPDTLVEVPPQIFEEMPQGGAALLSELSEEAQRMLVEAQARPTTKRIARWAKIAGDLVVERGSFSGRYLQLVRVVGTHLEIDGKSVFEGVIRHAKDTQRMLNYFVSSEAEAIALAPKAPFIADVTQIEGYETVWEAANKRPVSMLPYRAKVLNGVMLPPPQRVMAEANVQAITNARMQAADDLKAVTGIYDASLGARSNEQSGKAILARQSQGQTANFHFQDNLAMAIRYTGRILIDLIPKIYSGPRVLRMLGEDGQQEMVPVNQPAEFRGENVHLQLDAGRYDVAVSMGPSYQSRRQEAAAQLLELVRVNPAISQIAGDLLVTAMDIPDGKQIADRLKKLLPPEIRPPDGKQPPPQVLAQQLQQMTQQNQQLTQELHHALEVIETKAQEVAAKEQMELQKMHVDVLKTMATLQSNEHVETLKKEADLIGKKMQMHHKTELEIIHGRTRNAGNE